MSYVVCRQNVWVKNISIFDFVYTRKPTKTYDFVKQKIF